MAKRDVIYGYRICNECNKEYDLFELRSGSLEVSYIICPHCGERDDVWIRVVKECEDIK